MQLTAERSKGLAQALGRAPWLHCGVVGGTMEGAHSQRDCVAGGTVEGAHSQRDCMSGGTMEGAHLQRDCVARQKPHQPGSDQTHSSVATLLQEPTRVPQNPHEFLPRAVAPMTSAFLICPHL